MNAIEFAATHELKMIAVGSRVTCDPPPTDTDRDWLIWTDRPGDITMALALDGWDASGSLHEELEDGQAWASFRNGEDNIILTWDRNFYQSFLLATEAAKALNLMRREDRVILFQAIRAHWPWGAVV